MVVTWLTALPRAGTSIRTVIEFDTLGTVAIDVPSLVRALIQTSDLVV
jgi:hypothetical protein